MLSHSDALLRIAETMALHQQAVDELRRNLLGGAGEEAPQEGLQVLGERCGYGSGLLQRFKSGAISKHWIVNNEGGRKLSIVIRRLPRGSVD